MWVIASAAASTTSVGCAGPRLTLSAPPDSAPFEQRREAYKKKRPAFMLEVRGQSEHTSVELADGTLIHHLDDLVPLLVPNSTAARAADRAGRLQRRGNRLVTGGAIANVAGIWLVGAWLLSENGGPQGALGAGAIVSGLTAVVTGWISQRRGRSARKTLLRTMDASMQQRFGVCRDAVRRLVDCRQ